MGWEIPINGAGTDRGDPGSNIRNGESAGAAITGRGGDEDAGIGGSESANGNGIEVVGDDNATDAQGDDVDAVSHGGVEGREDVGVVAAGVPADLVGGKAGFGSHPCSDAARVAEGGSREDVAAGGDGGGVGAMAIGVSGRAGLGGLVHFAVGGLVTCAEEAGTDELAVAGGGGEVLRRHASAFPLGGDGPEVPVGEALVLGPDSGVDDSDDEVGAEVRLFEKAGAVRSPEAQKLRGARGLRVANLLGNEGENVWEGPEVLGFGGGELGGEAVEDGGVGVDDSAAATALGWWVQRHVRQGGEGGLVPELVGWENGRLGIGLDLDNVSSLLLLVTGNGRRRRRRS
jgi:hypothetical protein